jgi:mono/diheme cytochrome c family protein
MVRTCQPGVKRTEGMKIISARVLFAVVLGAGFTLAQSGSGSTAKQQTSTAKQQISTAKQQTSTAKQQISTAKQQISTAKQQITTAKQQIGTAWYTEKQAERGKTVYEESCSTCHGASLRGGANEFAAPALAGPFFYEKWAGKPLDDLYRYAAENMPPEGSKLSEAAYLDVTAYILEVLKYPAGTTELTADSPAMKQKIEAK